MTDYSSVGKRMGHIRNLMGLSLTEVHRLFGIAKGQLSRYEQDKVDNVTVNFVGRLVRSAKSCGVVCTTEWVLYQKGPEPHTLAPPAFNSADPQARGAIPADEFELMRTIHPTLVSIMIGDHAMAPAYCYGDFVAGIPAAKENIDGFFNIPVILEFADKTKKLRQINCHKQQYYIFGISNSFAPRIVNMETDIISIAPVFWHKLIRENLINNLMSHT